MQRRPLAAADKSQCTVEHDSVKLGEQPKPSLEDEREREEAKTKHRPRVRFNLAPNDETLSNGTSFMPGADKHPDRETDIPATVLAKSRLNNDPPGQEQSTQETAEYMYAWHPDVASNHRNVVVEKSRLYNSLARDTDEIRLIQILPGDWRDEVRCVTSVHSLTTTPRYTAISYTWGRPDSHCTIIIDGMPVPARKNLTRLLQQLRSLPSYLSGRYWIDFLCINQSDDVERTHQVGMMSKIYSGATQVVAWLGPSYGESALAMKAMRILGTQWSSKLADKLWWKAEGAAIRSLCERGYWTRLWVLQELALAKNAVLLCGNEQLQWVAFERSLSLSKTNPPDCRREQNLPYETTMNSRAMSMIQQILQSRNHASLLNQMFFSSKLECFDLRDKVYALLGIAASEHEAITPDYSLGISNLLNAVLRHDPWFRQIPSLMEVKRWCQRLAKIVGIELSQLMCLEQSTRGKAVPCTYDMTTCPLREAQTGISLWWTNFFEHDGAQALWFKAHTDGMLDEIFMTVVRQKNVAACKLLFGRNTLYSGHHFSEAIQKTALIYAVETGDQTMVGFLIHTGTDKAIIGPSARLHETRAAAALARAVEIGAERMVRMLLGKFGRDRIPAHSRSSPWTKELGDDVCRALVLSHSAIVEMLLPEFEGDISMLYGCALRSAVQDRSVAGVRECLCGMPSHVKWRTVDLEHAFAQAVQSKNEDLVEMLLQEPGLDVNGCFIGTTRYYKGETPLIAAAVAGHKEIVTLLLSRADVDVNCSCRGWTPLMSAASAGHKDIVALLLARPEIDVNGLQNGEVPTSQLPTIGQEGTANSGFTSELITLRQYEDEPPLMLATRLGHETMAALLLSKSEVDVNCVYESKTPLMTAVSLRRLNIASMLLERSDLQIELVWAALSCTEAMIGTILQKPGINVNRFHQGQSPLMAAMTRGHVGIVSLLLSRNDLQVNAESFSERSALLCGLEASNTAASLLLMKDGRTNALRSAQARWLGSQNRRMYSWYFRCKAEIDPSPARKALKTARKVATVAQSPTISTMLPFELRQSLRRAGKGLKGMKHSTLMLERKVESGVARKE